MLNVEYYEEWKQFFGMDVKRKQYINDIDQLIDIKV